MEYALYASLALAVSSAMFFMSVLILVFGRRHPPTTFNQNLTFNANGSAFTDDPFDDDDGDDDRKPEPDEDDGWYGLTLDEADILDSEFWKRGRNE